MMYEDWVAKDAAVKRTKKTARTLERMVTAGTLRREYVNVPGRRSLAVYNPEDIERIEQNTLKALPAKSKATRRTTTAPLDVVISISLADKEFLTLKESALLKGLPVSYLRDQVRSGTIPAVKLGGWRIHRDALRQHQVTLSLPVSRAKLLNGMTEENQISE